MTRIADANAKVVGLATLLTTPPSAATASNVNPDPAEMLERERCRVIEAARKEGYADGIARADSQINVAIEEAQRKVEQVHAAETERLTAANRRASDLLLAISTAATEAETAADAFVAEIAYAAVMRFLGRTLAEGSLLKLVCRQALEEYRQRPVVLRVPMDEVPMLRDLAVDASISIEGDARLAPGQCRLQTHKGDYDTSLEVRLDTLKMAFLHSVETGEVTA